MKQLGNQVREGIVQDHGTVLEAQVSGTGHSLCSMPLLLRVGRLSFLSLCSDHWTASEVGQGMMMGSCSTAPPWPLALSGCSRLSGALLGHYLVPLGPRLWEGLG